MSADLYMLTIPENMSVQDLLRAMSDLVAEREQLRTDLAAAVAERDEARTAYQVRNTEWHQHELIALALAERYKLRAEQAEARLADLAAERDEARQLYAKIADDRDVAESRLAAIDAAPTVAWQVDYIGEGEAVRHLITGDGPHAELYRDLPNSYAAVELIARPAKD